MSSLKTFVCFCTLMVMSLPAMALDLQEGMHGMQWGRLFSEFAHLTKVRESGQVGYFIPSSARYQAADQMVPTVVYGFYQGRFFATYIKLGSPVQFNNLKRHFSGKYGDPKAEHNPADQVTVLRWKVGDVNIKLKSRESGRDFKMALYYIPLAGELNRAQIDDIPPDLYRETAPEAKQPIKSMPLID